MLREDEKRTGGQKRDGKWLVLTESVEQEDGGYIHECGSEIMSATVARPIWDGPFPCSGSGRCQYQDTPYCPNCETKPGFHGSPIRIAG